MSVWLSMSVPEMADSSPENTDSLLTRAKITELYKEFTDSCKDY